MVVREVIVIAAYQRMTEKSRYICNMVDQSANIDIESLSEKVIKGVQKAVNDLIKANAAKGEDMVIGHEDGSFKIIPAKDLVSPNGSEKH